MFLSYGLTLSGITYYLLITLFISMAILLLIIEPYKREYAFFNILDFLLKYKAYLKSSIINPRRACARGLQYLVCLSVCLCVCVFFPYSGTSRNQAYKQQYQRLQRDTGMKYKKGFFFKTLRSEVMASFTHLE